MKSIKLINRTDYTFFQYYHNCDLVNKYNLKSVYQKPYLKSIVLDLSLDKIIDSFLVKFNHSTETVQILGFFLFYIIFTFLPFINFNKSNFPRVDTKNSYALKIIINKEHQIYSFLHDIYDQLQLDNTKEKNIKVGTNNNIILNESYKAESFFELENFLNKYVKSINTKELNFSLHFNFVQNIRLNSQKNFIQNFPFLNK